MHLYYENKQETFRVFKRKNQHYPPHLHSFLECVYITKGSLAIGQGQDLYAMETGDFALIFPNTIHHYQVFGTGESESVFLICAPEEAGIFQEMLTTSAARTPVIHSDDVDPEIRHSLKKLLSMKTASYQKELRSAYLQIILAKSFSQIDLIDKQMVGTNDIIYEVISYISAHYTEEITLGSLAQALGISPYVLSRVFSNTFHTNFNTYLNEMRLKHATALLRYSAMPITDVALDSGFSSLRTFNRFCKEKLRMSPRDYRAANTEMNEVSE